MIAMRNRGSMDEASARFMGNKSSGRDTVAKLRHNNVYPKSVVRQGEKAKLFGADQMMTIDN